MTSMHKSKDGVWRPCEAKKQDCRLGGHVTPNEIAGANAAIQRLGLSRRESLKTLDARTIKDLSEKERRYSNANTPAFLLGGNSEERPPALYTALPLPKHDIIKSGINREVTRFGKVIRDNKITAEAETVKLSGDRNGTAEMTVTFKRPGTKLGEMKTMTVTYSQDRYKRMISKEQLLRRMFSSAQDYDFFGSYTSDEQDEAYEDFVSKFKGTRKHAELRREKGEKNWKKLTEFFGHEGYQNISYDDDY